MKTSFNRFSSFVALIFILFITGISCEKDHEKDNPKNSRCPNAESTIANWPEVSKKVAQMMMDKYGQPHGVTPRMLVWNNNGPWKMTIVSRDPVQHNFPTPHPDLLEQSINYKVPVDKYDDMAAYDGSVILERTKGEMSARCDAEGANFLAINLGNDVATGKRSTEQARAYYTQAMKTFKETGQMDPYMKGFVFTVPSGGTEDPDMKTF
ncbi:MAG: hypothetical protein WKF70_06875 [Chitinophagaceae bacterium]